MQVSNPLPGDQNALVSVCSLLLDDGLEHGTELKVSLDVSPQVLCSIP